MKHKGIICGILAAVCYGTNPFGALPLYEEGVNTASVLFYRFFMAVLMLAIMLIVQRKDFSVTKGELKVLGSLGMLFAASSITYYQSFHFMDAGIASTILFVYPVMVAVIMATFFREKVTASTVSSIILALVGIGLLYKGDAGVSLSTMGVLLVMVSSLTYAVYIVIVNQSSRCLYRDSQPVEHTHVIFETHVLCITDLHVVSAGVFIYFARLASDVAALAPCMVLCLLAWVGSNGSFSGIHDHSRS